jgi:hypothetical protein
MKRCSNCGREQQSDDFTIVDFDDETEEFVRSGTCMSCGCGKNAPATDADAGVAQPDDYQDGDDGVDGDIDDVDADDTLQQQAMQLAFMCQADLKMISKMPADKFYAKYNSWEEQGKGSFEEVRRRATDAVTSLKGMTYCKDHVMPPGTYIVVGDSHGAYEIDDASAVVESAANYFKAKIIHVGHAMDQHGNISSIAKRKGTIVVALQEEIRELTSINSKTTQFTLVRGRVLLGDAVVRNQAVRDDYALGSTKNILALEKNCAAIIVGRHVHEMHTLTKNDHICRIVTPGCICERHMRKRLLKRTPQDIDMDTLAAVALDRDRSGRRQKEISAAWELGMTVVHVSDDMRSSIYPLRIKKTSKGWASAYGRIMFVPGGTRNCTSLGLAVGDAHVSNHDPAAIDVVDRVVSIVCPDYLVNLGDHVDCRSLNHHQMDRGEPITDEDVVNECGKASKIMGEMCDWAKERHYLVGNHSRFMQDFHKKFPQLESLINHHVMIGAKRLGYSVVELKGVLKLRENAKFIHGDMKIYGATGGDRHDKISSTMECDTMVGHCHNPSVRKGVYFVGMLGLLNQKYNEAEASNWMHGFGLISHYGGETFMTTVGFEQARLTFMGRNISGDPGCLKWNPPNFEAEIVYRQKK